MFAKLFAPGPQRKPRSEARQAKRLGEYELVQAYPMIAIHVMALVGVVWTLMGGVSWEPWAVAFVLYWVRMFGITGGFHRYFAHRTYRTSRWFQFVLAFLAQTASQRGALWWAAMHRDHHKYSDMEQDVHSPKQYGLAHAHLGWVYDRNGDTDYERIKDMAKYPELVLLNKYWQVPAVVLGVGMYVWMGWQGLLVGFCVSTVVLWHCTFTINSLSHTWGKQRYETGDTSRNNWVLALITMGEGWHNNHHHFMNSTRQGFFWWEIDMTYYLLKMMSWVGLVWDLKEPPARVYGEDLVGDKAEAEPEPASLEAA